MNKGTAVAEKLLSSHLKRRLPDLSFLYTVSYLYFSILSPPFPQGAAQGMAASTD